MNKVKVTITTEDGAVLEQFVVRDENPYDTPTTINEIARIVRGAVEDTPYFVIED